MPTFQCRTNDEDYGDEPHEVDAFDHESACDEFAEYCYSHRDGWEWMVDGPATFFVRLKGAEDEKKFTVETEFNPTFSSSEAA